MRAGLTSFMAMAYIIFTNPAILAAAGVPFSGAVVATCAAAGLMTILMGVVTNYPMCLAAGMGLNAVVAYTIVLGLGQSWQTAMGVVVLEGLVVLLLSATPLRRAVMDSIPLSLKQAIGVGIGLFITFIGLQASHLVRSHPVTLVTFGDPGHPVSALALIGLAVTVILLTRRIPGAILAGIVITALLGMLPIWHLPAGVGTVADLSSGAAKAARWAPLIPLPTRFVELPQDFSTFFAFDLRSALTTTLLPVAFAFVMTDFFDTMGTAIAVGGRAGFQTPEGRIPKIRSLLVIDSLAAVTGGLFGCSSNTCYVESNAGVAEGGRTGLTAVTCGALFLLAMLFVPLVAVVGGGVAITTGPGPADFLVRNPVTAGALITVGFLMVDNVRLIDWSDFTEGLPAFLTLVTMPLTFSITQGIGAGFISYTALKLFTGRTRELHPFMWIVSALFITVFAVGTAGM